MTAGVEDPELQVALARASAAEEELRRFAGAVSHDLRTPLAAVVGYLELLRLRLGEAVDATAAQYLERAELGAARVDLMLDALQRVARIPADPPREPVNWRELVDGAIAELDRDLLDAIDAVRVADPLPDVRGDARSLGQAVAALIDNALRHHPSPHEARVVVRVNESGGLVVEDDGTGVADADLTRLVELFRTGKSPRPGVGAGLAVADRVAQAHGGSLVLSRSPMGGLRATLRLGG